MLKRCEKCRERSIATKVRKRKKDGIMTITEYCINKNPLCKHKIHRTIGEGNGIEDKKKDGTRRQTQLELF